MEEESISLPNDIAEEYFKKDFRPIKNVYIDLEVLQDIYLGALLLNTTTQKEIEYINHMLPEYDERYDDDVWKYFPALKIDKDIINKTINDESLSRKLAIVSPWNRFHQDLPSFISWIMENNQRCKYKETVNIFIGSTTISYPQDLKTKIINQIRSFNPNLSISILNRDFMSMDKCDIEIMDVLVFNDLSHYIDNNDFNVMTMSELKFSSVKVFSYPIIREIIKEHETAEELITNFKKIFNIFTDFFYIERSVIFV